MDIFLPEPTVCNERKLGTYVHGRKFLASCLRPPIQSGKASVARRNELSQTNHLSLKPRVNECRREPIDGKPSGSLPAVASSDADFPQSDKGLIVDNYKENMQKEEWRTSCEDGAERLWLPESFPTVANMYIVQLINEAVCRIILKG